MRRHAKQPKRCHVLASWHGYHGFIIGGCEAVVMVRNDNGTLPLRSGSVQGVAVIGPSGDAHFGEKTLPHTTTDPTSI